MSSSRHGPDAYEKAVDRFLDDPAYGERWARMWLDQARYADSAGYGSDPLRPTIWRYRDWVIDAFNRNLPFDRFTLEQIAGDLLPDPSLDQRIATAFHRNTMTNTEGGTDDEEFRVAAIKDRVDTTMQVWMGLTMGCAKCHSHKFDPITQDEYYKFLRDLQSDRRPGPAAEAPVIPRRRRSSDSSKRSTKRLVRSQNAGNAHRRTGGRAGEMGIEPGPAGAATRKELPKEIQAILDLPADRRTGPQAESLAKHFRTLAPELKPVRDRSRPWKRRNRRSRACR